MAELKKYLDTTALGTLVDQIKAEDAKMLAAAQKYTDDAGKLYDAAGSAASAESNAKAHAEAKVKELADGAVKANTDAIDAIEADYLKAADKTELQGNIDAVDDKADKNAEDIAAIKHADTGILAVAKKYTDDEVAEVQGNIDALAGKVGSVPEGSTVMGIITNIQENAYDDTAIRGLIDGLDGEIDNLDEKKADKTQVATDIETAVNAEKSAREAAVAGVQGQVDAIKGDYLKAADKTELEGKIDLKADKTALDAVSEVANAAVKQSDYDVKVKALEDEDARIVGLVESEAAKAREEEGKLNTRLVEVETFFKTAEGETLDTALDTLVEIQKYLDGEGEVADQMLLDIAANKKAIEDHVAVNHDFAGADAALKTELMGEIGKKADSSVVEGINGRVGTLEGEMDAVEGKVSTLEGKVSTLEGEMDGVQAAVATKAEAQDLTDAIATLNGVDAGQETRIAALEAKFGGAEGSVEDMIADAKQAAIDTAAGDATSKANAAEANAKAHANDLNTAMNSRVEALEAIDHEHANKAELDLIVSGDKAKWDEAYAKRHEHANKAELDKIADGDKAKWDAMEQNAKDYADGLNNTMNSKVDGIDGRVTANANAVATKAAQDDLDAAVLRIAANESAIAANTSAINSFTAITPAEVEALFA